MQWWGIDWREPAWLLLAVLPLILVLLRRLWADRRIGTFVDNTLLPWVRSRAHTPGRWRGRVAGTFIVAAWASLAVAMAGPRSALYDIDSDVRHAKQTMLVFDLSRSMSAADVEPDRLARARLEALDLLKRLENHRVGIVVFAHKPHLLCPPTADLGAVRYYLQDIRTRLLPTEGTHIHRALRFAEAQFSQPDPAKRSIVLFSNGLEAADSATTGLTKKPKQTKIASPLYILGIGTVEGSPLFNQDGKWLQYAGKPVISRLDEQQLRQLANEMDGVYARVSDSDAHWKQLYREGIAQQTPPQQQQAQGSIVWEYYVDRFLLAGIVLLVLAVVIRQRGGPARTTPAVMLVGCALVATVHAPPSLAEQADLHRRAYTAFKAEHYEQAERLYRQLNGYAARMGQASSAYQRGDYATALQQYQLAILRADNDDERANAIFNLGNSYFRLGNYRGAAALFEDVKRYRPKDEYADINRNFSLYIARHSPRDRRPNFTRQGRGPRSMELPEGTEITKGGVVLGDDQSPEPIIPLEPGEDSAHLETLIERGLAYSQLSSKQIERRADPTWTYKITDPQHINPHQIVQQSDNAGLWKRLFEIEEGFPAPVATPHEMEGTPPW